MSDGYKRPASVVYLGGGPALKVVRLAGRWAVLHNCQAGAR